MNILVYSGSGTSKTSVQQALNALKRYSGKFYDIKMIDDVSLCNEPWESGCELLVIPGGRDLPYLEAIKASVISRIKTWIVEGGGRYLGICAGAYFGSSEVEFDKGGPHEVLGSRPLSLFAGKALGPIFPGFTYNGHESAFSAKVVPAFKFNTPPFKSYYNGGCHFVDLTLGLDQILARYSNGENAVIMSKVGKGSALLSGVHLEYDSNLIDSIPEGLRDELKPDEEIKNKFWADCLRTLGLQVSFSINSNNSLLSPLVVYSSESKPSWLSNQCQKDANQFKLADQPLDFDESNPDYLVYLPKDREGCPGMTFDPSLFFDSLKTCQFGHNLIYAERIMSTQTLLMNNPSFAGQLPSGTVVLAGDQLAGKGRGKNVWLSSTGCLQFTMVLDHANPKTLSIIQYLVATAMAETVSCIPGLNLGDIRLKWPNDVYILKAPDGELKKAGGILVTSYCSGRNFRLYIGFGINVYDTPWSFCINDLVDGSGPNVTKEMLLSSFLATFESLYNQMIESNRFPAELYYKHWLHQDTVVFLEEEQKQVQIKGVDENGYLIATEVNGTKRYLLQPDGNSFDMMKKLITRKVQ